NRARLGKPVSHISHCLLETLARARPELLPRARGGEIRRVGRRERLPAIASGPPSREGPGCGRGCGQTPERHHLPVRAGAEDRHDRVDDGLWPPHDEPVHERGIGRVEQAHEANRQTMEGTAPVHERYQRHGTRTVLHEERLGPAAGTRGPPAAAEPFVTEEGRSLATLRGHRLPDGRDGLEGLERVETSDLHALTPASLPLRWV